MRPPKHGMSKTRIYHVWVQMLGRCRNKKNKDYQYYGGRGISVCARWLTFENFIKDMGMPAIGMTIDRIDSGGDYEPTNCRWADRATQSTNKRQRVSKYKHTVQMLAEMGKTAGEIAGEMGINRKQVYGVARFAGIEFRRIKRRSSRKSSS